MFIVHLEDAQIWIILKNTKRTTNSYKSCLRYSEHLHGVLPTVHIIFVWTGIPLSRRQANGVYAKIGVHLVKGWVILEEIGNTALNADVGNFLMQYHGDDLNTAMEELTKCANTRIPNFLAACLAQIRLWGIIRLGQCDRTGDLRGASVCR
jgi:hypothetical protein